MSARALPEWAWSIRCLDVHHRLRLGRSATARWRDGLVGSVATHRIAIARAAVIADDGVAATQLRILLRVPPWHGLAVIDSLGQHNMIPSVRRGDHVPIIAVCLFGIAHCGMQVSCHAAANAWSTLAWSTLVRQGTSGLAELGCGAHLSPDRVSQPRHRHALLAVVLPHVRVWARPITGSGRELKLYCHSPARPSLFLSSPKLATRSFPTGARKKDGIASTGVG